MKNLKKLLRGTKSLKSSQKRAFTLAEVLITLAIIGVVAALTIPVVVHKYQQKALYTQFMKVYNTIVNTVNLSVAKNGAPETWAYDENDQKTAIEQYITPYLNIISKCERANKGQCLPYTVTNLVGDEFGPAYDFLLKEPSEATNNSPAYTLADGSVIGINLYGGAIDDIEFYFDTNGAKGPNVLGRDMFRIQYYNKTDEVESGKYVSKWIWYTEYQKGGEEGSNPGEITISNCDPSGEDYDESGMECGGRLLLEGKMDY